jgi:Domain of unknown function (DUF6473)
MAQGIFIDSASGYQARDRNIVDYQLWQLDTPQAKFSLRGPQPASLAPGSYCCALGAAFTFGRFVAEPYPTLLAQALGIESLNLGFSGIGPAFYNNPYHQDLLDWVNRSKFVTILVFSGRSQANSRFRTLAASQECYILDDGQQVPADFAYQQLLATATPEEIAALIAETRERYMAEFLLLLASIKIPKILVWFSKRSPDYQESYNKLFKLFSNFPHLVNRAMIDQLRPQCQGYIEYINTEGLPQVLTHLETGEPTAIERERYYRQGKIHLNKADLTQNNYYPSPEMHRGLAAQLVTVCQPFL